MKKICYIFHSNVDVTSKQICHIAKQQGYGHRGFIMFDLHYLTWTKNVWAKTLWVVYKEEQKKPVAQPCFLGNTSIFNNDPKKVIEYARNVDFFNADRDFIAWLSCWV